MNTSDGVLPDFVPRTWRYALIGGIVSMPLTVGLYWYAGTESHFSLNMVTVGGFVAGYLAKRDAAAAKSAGTRAGLVGALPGLGWFLRGIVERGDALSSQVAVVSVVFVGVAVVCIGAVAGYLGGAVGGWAVEKLRQRSSASGA
ncbi:hypothetical protein C2R22_13625 [Salinigranum rubrum]|uniref:DUF5518 domain-containing protein n=1 Tax=Salinigranum rubrum TaxID=755307 RepID=A0A2I8VKV9_9EURY|nr:DUF5518 domain-containing protein [Salinigranum rubrum]AUV82548.1 hypothetical protein C2R22_13625 [Salinigranum rubrum]